MQSLSTQEDILKELRAKKLSEDIEIQQGAFGRSMLNWMAYREGDNLSDSQDRLINLRLGLLAQIQKHSKDFDATDDSIFHFTQSYKQEKQNSVLSILQFDGMDTRAEMMADAHKNTFSWIFSSENAPNGPGDNFRTWLESDQQLYWITGKAGSGKSTLMKYVCRPDDNPSRSNIGGGMQDARCMRYLQQWSGEQKMVVASFYFWAAGSKLQTSKEGLYRTLLHQIFSRCPEAIPQTFPDRWVSLCFLDVAMKLSEDELRNALFRLLQILSPETKICLFIDGLDEFEGDPSDLLDVVKRIIDNTSVKVCCASRPWLVFADTFKTRPSLLMEVLTFDDIKSFIESRFTDEPNFKHLTLREPSFAVGLIENIVRKASGVFLWVKLVVISLLDGMKHGDRVSDLQRRLDSLPPDLEDLYDRILDNLDPFYLEHAAQYFSLLSVSPTPPSFMMFSLADEEDEDYPLRLELGRVWSPVDFEMRKDTVQRRLNSRTKGLLEISGGFDSGSSSNMSTTRPIVQYLHKTVKDYVESPRMKQQISSFLKAPFDPHIKLCAANLAIFKIEATCLNRSEKSGMICFSERIAQCMKHAACVTPENTSLMMRYLDALYKAILDSKYLDWLDIPLSQIISALEGPRRWTYEAQIETFGDTFLSLAVKCGVVEYIKGRARPGAIPPATDMPRTEIASSWRQPWGYEEDSAYGVTRLGRSNIWRRFLEPLKARWRLRVVGKMADVGNPWCLLWDAATSSHPNPAMVSTILGLGADPNMLPWVSPREETGLSTSVWIETLSILIAGFLLQHWQLEEKAAWLAIGRMMIAHGARMDKPTVQNAMRRAMRGIEFQSAADVSRFDQEGTAIILREFKRCKPARDIDFLAIEEKLSSMAAVIRRSSGVGIIRPPEIYQIVGHVSELSGIMILELDGIEIPYILKPTT